MPEILALGRLRQEDLYESKANLEYIARFHLKKKQNTDAPWVL